MAIQWADSFQRYGTGVPSNTAMRDGLPYNNWLGQCQDDPDPVSLANGEKVVSILNGVDNNPLVEGRIALPTPVNGVVGIAARYWLTSTPGGNARRVIATFTTAVPVPIVSVVVETNGALSIYNSIIGALIQTTTSPVLTTNTHNHIESVFNSVTGLIQVRVNGVQRLSGTASVLNSVIAFVQPLIRVSTDISGGPMFVKDLVIWDGFGTQNNTFMGSVVVRRRAPSADVALNAWTPSTGIQGTPLLAKTSPNDTTFVSSLVTSASGMRYDIENLPSDVTSVRGIVAVSRSNKVSGGDASTQAAVISGVSQAAGGVKPATTAFSYAFDVFEIDPATGVAWTPASFDAARIEIDRAL
jgi:hypothetical protein